MSAKLTERDEQGRIVRLGFVPNFGNSWLYIYGWMNGGEFMSQDGRTCTLNEPRIVDALGFMTRIYDKLGGAKEVYAFQSSFQGGDLDPFITGKIVMKIDGFWVVSGTLASFGRDLNYGVAPPPMPARELAAGRRPITWVGGWCYAIPSTAKQKKASWDLIRFLSTRRAIAIMAESQRLAAESQGRVFVPAQMPGASVNEWLYGTYVYNKPGMDPKVAAAVRTFNDLLPEARYRPVTPVGQVLWNQHIEAMENAVFHKATPHAALDRGTVIVQRELDRALAPPRGRPVRWAGVFVLYGVLLIAAVVLNVFLVLIVPAHAVAVLAYARRPRAFAYWAAATVGALAAVTSGSGRTIPAPAVPSRLHGPDRAGRDPRRDRWRSKPARPIRPGRGETPGSVSAGIRCRRPPRWPAPASSPHTGPHPHPRPRTSHTPLRCTRR